MSYSISQQGDEVRHSGRKPVLEPEPVFPEKQELLSVCATEFIVGHEASPHGHDERDGKFSLDLPVYLLNGGEATSTGVIAQDPAVHVVVQLVEEDW